eukprot:gene12351-14588_t
MLKAKEYDYKDSNCADIGSAMDKAAREAAGATEPAWEGAGQEPGTKIWRIEQFKVKEWNDPDYYNTFFAGDAYIVLNTFLKEDKLLWDVYFWLGKDCSQDEAGTAAYKTVELDDVLKGAPVQHREVMGYESPGFLKLFSPCLKTVEGGIDSGFRKVVPEEYRPRLLRIVQQKAGKSTVVAIREVPMSNEALNQGDVYIMDKGLELVQWNGSDCGIFEKNKAAELVRSIDAERNEKCEVTVIEGYDENPEFHAALEGSAADVKTKEEGEAASVFLAGASADPKLFKVSDAGGSLSFEETGCSEPLDENDAYILDAGYQIFVWIGKGASPDEKKEVELIIFDVERNGKCEFAVNEGYDKNPEFHAALEMLRA